VLRSPANGQLPDLSGPCPRRRPSAHRPATAIPASTLPPPWL